jgi:hypothetical protein
VIQTAPLALLEQRYASCVAQIDLPREAQP